jgi:hypothetical protein
VCGGGGDADRGAVPTRGMVGWSVSDDEDEAAVGKRALATTILTGT